MKYLVPSILLTAGIFAVVALVPLGFMASEYDNVFPQELSASTSPTRTAESAEPTASAVDDRPVVAHVPIPEAVKAIYMSSCVAGTPSFRERLVAFIEETEVNSVMIDIKDYSGTISFPPESQAWQPAWQAAECGARDMRAFIADLHERDIFVIGRITVFQDPFYTSRFPEQAVKRADRTTVWQDYKGLSFIDVGARDYWDAIVELSVDSYNIGFDELNFDYVRYPSDGPMNDIAFTLAEATEYGADKQANLEAFFAFLHQEMSDPANFADYRHDNIGREAAIPYISADLFGMTTTNYDDLSIGQIQERAAPYFDFIAPMVYPSHYPDSFLGLGNPNDYPYQVVYHAMQSGVDRMTATTTRLEGFKHEPIMVENASGTPVFSGEYSKPSYPPSKLRTWIQDFDYGGDYDAADVRAQIQASYDAGVDSWMIWAPSNIYTRAALEPASVANE